MTWSSGHRGLAPALVTVLVGSALLAGCTETPSVSRRGVDSGDGDGLAVSAGLTRFDAGQRTTAPVLEGPSVAEGGRISSSHPGRVVVVNVWRSDCGPCRAEGAALADAAGQTAGQATFLGLDVDDQQPMAQAFLRTGGSPYAHLFDPDGQQLLKFAGVLPVQAIPSTVVVDRQGRVAARVIGPVSAITLTGLVQDTAASS